MLLFSDFIWILFCSCEIYNFIIKLFAKFVRQILALLRFLKCQPRLCYFCKILYKLSKVKLCFYIIPIKIFTKRIFMNSFLRKTFGGLSISYYLRQLFFGGLITALFFWLQMRPAGHIGVAMSIFLVLNAFIYPYARFVYESIVGFILGDNVFFVNVILLMVVKFTTMLLCYAFAMFIAPIGLAYLYYYHTKNNTFDNE